MVGSVTAGTPLVIVPMVGGTLKSEKGFEPALDAELYVSLSRFNNNQKTTSADLWL